MAIRQFQLRQPQGPISSSVDNLIETIKKHPLARENNGI